MNEQQTIHQTTTNIKTRLTDTCENTYNNATLEAEVLLAHTLGQSRTYLRTYPQQAINSPTIEQLNSIVERRISGEPIAYITGHQEFWSLDLDINKDTLIPRPETETLVTCALEKIPRDKSIRIADIGTGSGAIALAIASERPACTITATDICESALIIAKNNAVRLSLSNLEFHCGNWFEPIQNELFDIVISNPPYIANNDPHLQKGDLRFEPIFALRSGHDGLDAIRHIIRNAKKHLIKDGWLLLEHGYDQRDRLITLLKDNEYSNIIWHNDIQNQARVILAQKDSKKLTKKRNN
ncbi:MAG: peptide chain release factor N(5)-glutamine methyltransferase [Gammaproteobacteria bacterium]|nr:peptide chain release factor N(5)-glutamine methyltransferase [Gammaproteobacteria bacterium]